MDLPVISTLTFFAAYPIVQGLRLLFVRSEYSFGEKLLYAPFYTLARMLWRVEVDGGKKVVDRAIGGAIIISNHRSSVDPFFIQLAAGRRVHWMVAAEYFKHPVFGFFLRLFQAVPTNRSGSDTTSTRKIIQLAGEGRLVGLFPEGRINMTDVPLLPLRPGAVLVAQRTDSVILPMWIDGAPNPQEVWHPLIIGAKVTVYIGEPVEFKKDRGQSREEQVEQLAGLILAARPQPVPPGYRRIPS